MKCPERLISSTCHLPVFSADSTGVEISAAERALPAELSNLFQRLRSSELTVEHDRTWRAPDSARW